jgi:hypothetical protein
MKVILLLIARIKYSRKNDKGMPFCKNINAPKDFRLKA